MAMSVSFAWAADVMGVIKTINANAHSTLIGAGTPCSRTGIVAEHWIPVMLAFSTGSGVLASLIFGRLYDRVGLLVVL